MNSQKEKVNPKALLFIVFAAIVGGGLPVFTKIAVREISPLNFTFLRFFIASIFILPFFLREKPKIDKSLISLLPISLLATIGTTFFTFGVHLTDATVSQMLYAAVPIIAAVFSYFILKERFSGKKVTGIFIGFVGAVLIIFLPVLLKGGAGHIGFLGNMLILIAVILWSLYAVLTKTVEKKSSPIYLTSIFFFLTAIVLSPFFITDVITNPSWWHILSMKAILSTLYVGIFGTFIYLLLYQYAIKYSTPVVGTMIQYIQPISAYVWAYFFLSERLTIGLIIGSLLVFAGAWLTTRAKG